MHFFAFILILLLYKILIHFGINKYITGIKKILFYFTVFLIMFFSFHINQDSTLLSSLIGSLFFSFLSFVIIESEKLYDKKE